ncbi:MAG: cell division protein SepF [Actinomycetaceae bacterium]|nr:cell division protein SepF [Actinomycetaceae bacterium]
MGIFDRITAKATPYDEDFDYDEGQYEDEYYEEEVPESPVSPVRSLPTPEVARIVTVWVDNYNAVEDFAKEFRNGLPVILNLSDAPDDQRRRIVDFALGLGYGMGYFNQISDDVFLLTPRSIELESYGHKGPIKFL